MNRLHWPPKPLSECLPKSRRMRRLLALTAFSASGFAACGANPQIAGHSINVTPAEPKQHTVTPRQEETPPPATPPGRPPETENAVLSPEAGPVLNESFHAIRYAAQRAVLGGDSPPGPRALRYAISELESSAQDPTDPVIGRWVPLEGEAHLSLFYQALDALEGSARAKVRVLAYGASHTQADIYTDYLRRYLQARFGDGGQGFVHLGKVNRGYKTAKTEVHMQNLKVRHAQSIRNMKDGPLGLLGAEAFGTKVGAFGEIELSANSTNTEFELAYLKIPRGGQFSISVDKKQIATVDTRADESGPGFSSFQAEAGARVIRAQLRGKGPVHLLGLTAENKSTGVVVDTLGINGSRMSNQLKWNEKYWSEAVARRDPGLVIYAFGTNETMDLHQKIHLYEEEVRQVIRRIKRAAPGASCVLFSPFDFPRKENDVWKTRSRLLEILEIQKRVSEGEGCAYFDAYKFMGGEGSMDVWALQHPPLARSDHIHLTPTGYVRAAIAFTDALMRRYDSERHSENVSESLPE